ncbi:SIS domain-containing protein [Streptomyces sp. NA02950]|uniref:SIS domain-containing protein n=1 Tax=Streptomyces sp. NA02950 TaxID=2742137 RepID=UPI0015924EEB|nr:SIS domain-containing protein [Streptomyces sp. NA02950]QKV90572.1 SIS domain-containing protein [Streptomyces sp. NA02950]
MSTALLGRHMHAEMSQQPEVLANLADRFAPIAGQVNSIAEGMGRIAGVAFLARGSSDHAALLGRYAVEHQSGLPTCLVAPSIATAYQRSPEHFNGWLLVALSQSGQTPEIVDIAGRYAACGASVITVTNDPGSPLARLAHHSVDLAAGPEKAVPATKTVTSQMLAVLAIASGLGPGGLTAADAAQLPRHVSDILADHESVAPVATRPTEHHRIAVVGRGACYPAALETALKVQETTGSMAHGFSTADFRHGPIAACGPGSRAVLFAGSGPADDDTRALRGDLTRRGAQVSLSGTGIEADARWPALGHMGECLLATVRGQQLALATAAALGIDPDQPTGLNKVTLTH